MSEKGTEGDDVSEETEATDTDATTESTDDTETTETYEISEDETGSGTFTSAAGSDLKKEERYSTVHPISQDLLNLEGRHIKAEDFEWGRSPVLPLADIIIEAAGNIRSTDFENFLKNATDEQKLRTLELLPLDMPLEVTIPLLTDGIYWKRLCLRSWPAWDCWRYGDNWKSMFVHRSVQELIENFVPGENDISEFRKHLEVYSKYVTTLKIRKLMKVAPINIEIDVHSENFDEDLDNFISTPTKQVYLEFEKIFVVLPSLEDLSISLSPMYIDFEDFCFNNADFNCFFRALKKLEKLEKFRTSNGNFSNAQISELLKIFLTHKSLREVNFSFNFLDDYTCKYISRLLMSNCPLESVNLMNNKITDVGAMSIAAALLANSKVKKLNLSLNMIGDKGATALAKVLLKNNSLAHLDVSKNKITEEGGTAFAELVKGSKILISLKIQENVLGENAGKEFLIAVTENVYLLELGVQFCGFGEKDESLIYRAILRNRNKVPYSTYWNNNKDSPASEFLF